MLVYQRVNQYGDQETMHWILCNQSNLIVKNTDFSNDYGSSRWGPKTFCQALVQPPILEGDWEYYGGTNQDRTETNGKCRNDLYLVRSRKTRDGAEYEGPSPSHVLYLFCPYFNHFMQWGKKNIPATSSPHPHNIPTTRYYQQLLFAESMAWSAAPSLADVRSHRRSRPGRRRLQSGLDLGIRTSTRSSYKVVSCGFTRTQHFLTKKQATSAVKDLSQNRF